MAVTVESTAHIPVGLMETGARASVAALGEAQALGEAGVSGEVPLGASVAAGALTEATVAAICMLPGEILPMS